MSIPKITKDTYVIADLHLGHKNVTEWETSRQEAVDAGKDV